MSDDGFLRWKFFFFSSCLDFYDFLYRLRGRKFRFWKCNQHNYFEKVSTICVREVVKTVYLFGGLRTFTKSRCFKVFLLLLSPPPLSNLFTLSCTFACNNFLQKCSLYGVKLRRECSGHERRSPHEWMCAYTPRVHLSYILKRIQSWKEKKN